MSISPRTRREAILLLDVAASQEDDDPGRLADDLGVSDLTRLLASQAQHAIYYSEWRGGHWRAHAAGLLRDGWSPGDPVVRLQHGAKP